METIYRNLHFRTSELRHRYGRHIHILAHPFLMTHLARLSSNDLAQPHLSHLAALLYHNLCAVVLSAEFPKICVRQKTRMAAYHPEGIYEGEVIDTRTNVVCVDIARAGMVPSQICFEMFCQLLDPKKVRQDHFFMNRRTDARGRVTGVDLSGSKIGGRIDGTILVVPDPMGATGSSLSAVLDHYQERRLGRPVKVIAMNLIVTPEFIRRLKMDHPEVVVYAIRLDRGLSSRPVLRTIPGARWREECGLNDKQYIVPGAGGMGELFNNSPE